MCYPEPAKLVHNVKSIGPPGSNRDRSHQGELPELQKLIYPVGTSCDRSKKRFRPRKPLEDNLLADMEDHDQRNFDESQAPREQVVREQNKHEGFRNRAQAGSKNIHSVVSRVARQKLLVSLRAIHDR